MTCSPSLKVGRVLPRNRVVVVRMSSLLFHGLRCSLYSINLLNWRWLALGLHGSPRKVRTNSQCVYSELGARVCTSPPPLCHSLPGGFIRATHLVWLQQTRVWIRLVGSDAADCTRVVHNDEQHGKSACFLEKRPQQGLVFDWILGHHAGW